MIRFLHHPIARRVRRATHVGWALLAILLAVAVVSALTLDLGPSLRGLAESQGSKFIKRPMHIGRLSIHLFRGKFAVDDLVIEGFEPTSRPFLVAKRISVSMLWAPLLRREVVLDDIEMIDWDMYVEVLPGGRHNFPKFTPDTPPNPNRQWRTTARYVRAHRGGFTFEDRGVPWSTVARNLEVIVAKPHLEYRGQAKFSGGTVTIQGYEPMTASLNATFKLDGALARFDHMELVADGSESIVTGVADLAHFPEMTYHVRSKVHFPRMREIFFARDRFALHGDGEFTGTWHLFKGGRDLSGTFHAPLLGVNDFRFTNVRGALRWLPDRFEVTDGTTALYRGHAGFSYVMAPLGLPDTRAVATFTTDYRGVDLAAFGQVMQIRGLQLGGRATGRNELAWPLGRFSERRGGGAVHVEPIGGEPLLAAELPRDIAEQEARRASIEGPFDRARTAAPIPIGGVVTYAFGPDWIELEPSHVATETTYVAFLGRTAWGAQSQIPFHVTSSDWQESDRLLSGILTAFGSPTNPVQIAGYGTFDGVMTESFARPRIEGDFSGNAMRAWHVNWGQVSGHAVIENSYAQVKDVTIRSGTSAMYADGTFSLGYPRKDGGEEINARIRVLERPVEELRMAFGLYDYPVEGSLSGEFHVFGAYAHPYGFGLMSLAQGRAYTEPFDLATASLRFEGAGVRLDGIEIRKGSGRGVGAAYVGFDGTYSFNVVGRKIPIETLSAAQVADAPPLTGLLDFTASGSATFDAPAYDVKASATDVFVGDEGVGSITGDLSVRGRLLNGRFEAASSRLAVSGAGRIELDEQMNADVRLQVSDTSLDPYLRAFQPALSPFTTAIASGQIHVVGQLTDVDQLRVTGEVEKLDLSFFDYRLRNAAPIHVALDGPMVRVDDLRLEGEDTELDLSGVVSLEDRTLTAHAGGTANLGIIQGFVRDVRSSGRASVTADISGALASPTVNGTMTIDNGRIRHFGLPHALENINGAVQFDARGMRLDGVHARLGGGDVAFGGRVEVEGYRPRRADVTMTGRGMRLRFPQGMRSLVDADLSLTGNLDSATLSGNVLVRSALYTQRFDAGGSIFDFANTATSTITGEPTTQPSLPLRYDVRINAPSTLRVENNIARVVANADLQLSGTYDKPLLFGRAQVDRGQVTFEGKRYVVTRGSVDFNNPIRIEPFFDVEVETRVRVPRQTYRVTASVAGPTGRLNFALNADPPLSEIETLALILGDVAPGQDVEFRQYNTSITPQEQLLRERAARALTGVISSEVGRVAQETLKIDTFQLNLSVQDLYQQSARLSPGARVTIGKRLSDRVFLTFSRSLVTAARDQLILLEYDQNDRFSWVLSQNEDDTYALEVRVRHVF